jgi:serine phosphatase RsbU (regulator of sigma subunit)/pSer/pThr/pTyr-binding forkhead associated (FHA) protein
MAFLLVVKGQNQGQKVPLDADTTILGRNPECQVVIPVTSVSREHARITRVRGRFYIEDLKSRNGTYVNDKVIPAEPERTLLKNKDRIRICDFVADFHEMPPLPEEVAKPQPEPEAEEPDGSTTVEATLSHSSNLILETQPAEKLKALLEISADLSKTLQLDPLLPKIVDTLFRLFKQADRGFIILTEEGTGRFVPKVIKTRRQVDEANARFSRSIVRQCLATGQAFLSDDASADKRIPLSQSVLDFRIRSVMCAPLVSGEGHAFGVIQLDTQDRTKKFTQDDLKLLAGVANQAAVALENARFHEDQVARERLKRDLELAQQVQLSFLPKELPVVPGYEFFAYYEPAQEVGGDYYGFVPLAGQKLAITVGDVAGKGVPAALLMAKLSSDARFCLLTETDPARAVTTLNSLLYPHTSQMDRFVTLASAVLDFASHTVTLVSGGHPPPLLVRRGRGLAEAMPRDVPGVPLGMLEEHEYTAYPVRLEPGDGLLLFTDGVIDAVNVRNASFGYAGVHGAAELAGAPLSAQPLGERLIRAVTQHADGRSQHDDITLVCLSRNE